MLEQAIGPYLRPYLLPSYTSLMLRTCGFLDYLHLIMLLVHTLVRKGSRFLLMQMFVRDSEWRGVSPRQSRGVNGQPKHLPSNLF